MKKVKKRLSRKPSYKKINKKQLTIYLYNVVEDEWSFLSAIYPIEKRASMMNSMNDSSECYLFANTEDEFIYISPIEISRTFKHYYQSISGNKKVDIIVPQFRTGLLCKDLYTNKQVFSDVVKIAKKYHKVVMISYASSPEFLELKERMIQLGVNVSTPEAPELENAWTVNFYGSKSGIRQLAQQSRAVEPDFIMPEGVICVGKLDAARIAANKYINEKGVVLKTNKGSGGQGVLIFRDGELPKDYKSCEKRIFELLSQDGYWDRFPIIIEELVNANLNNNGGFPNIEFKIHKNGQIEMLYYCVMMVTPEGKYYGLDIHEDVINERMAARIIDTGYFIAEKYSEAGYRGHFDIDMIASKNRHIYVCESNTRNTGGTDIFKLTRKLFGEDFFSDVYVLNRNNYKFNGQNSLTFDKVINALGSLSYNKKTKEGVVISSSAPIKDKQLLYTVFGKNKKRAYQIHAELLEKLSLLL